MTLISVPVKNCLNTLCKPPGSVSPFLTFSIKSDISGILSSKKLTSTHYSVIQVTVDLWAAVCPLDWMSHYFANSCVKTRARYMLSQGAVWIIMCSSSSESVQADGFWAGAVQRDGFHWCREVCWVYLWSVWVLQADRHAWGKLVIYWQLIIWPGEPLYRYLWWLVGAAWFLDIHSWLVLYGWLLIIYSFVFVSWKG